MSADRKPVDLVDGKVRRNPGEPSPEQAKSDDYKKPRVTWRGLTIAIENPAGSVRRGKGWEVRMKFDYGEIVGSMGVDGDPVDIYLGPNLDDAPMVYVVHQRKNKDWEKYDEDKVMAGFLTEEDARQAFLSNYTDPRFLGPITAMPIDEFITKVRGTKEKPTMIKALFLKTHIDSYTKKDGTFVAAHEDGRQKHSPEQMAKWAAEKKARESNQAMQRMKERDAEKQINQRRADDVASTAMGKNFTDDEIAAIRDYYLNGDKSGALAEGRNATVAAIERKLRADDIEIEHVSESQGGKSKSLYVKIGGSVVRVSDHELPMTAARESDRESRRSGRWSREVVVSDWHSTSINDYLAEIKGDTLAKCILFFKAHVGPYLRRGKLVNLAGYQGKQARAAAGDAKAAGQMDMFGDNPTDSAHASGGNWQMPIKDAIKEHKELIHAAETPGKADDKREVEKQKEELGRMEAATNYRAAVTSTKTGPDDDNPRRKYYVTIAREGRGVSKLAGPFDTHDEAKAHVDHAREEAVKVDPRAHFDAFGTAGVEADEHKPGVLNERLGVGVKPPQSAPVSGFDIGGIPVTSVKFKENISLKDIPVGSYVNFSPKSGDTLVDGRGKRYGGYDGWVTKLGRTKIDTDKLSGMPFHEHARIQIFSKDGVLTVNDKATADKLSERLGAKDPLTKSIVFIKRQQLLSS